MRIIYAILSTLVLVLPAIYNKLKSFRDENNIFYDISVHLGKNIKQNNFSVS